MSIDDLVVIHKIFQSYDKEGAVPAILKPSGTIYDLGISRDDFHKNISNNERPRVPRKKRHGNNVKTSTMWASQSRV